MRKSSIVTCCVTFCLLSAVPQNRGAKLLESLSCFRPLPQKRLVCSWSENNVLGTLVNMTLVTMKTSHASRPNEYNIACQDKRVTNSSPTHLTWTCDVPWGPWIASDHIYFSFVLDGNLETQLNTMEEKDDAKPQNLKCSDTNGNLTCSWQIREEIAESINFDLFYDNDEKECRPECQPGDSRYLSCHCTIMTEGHQNAAALLSTIRVKPRKLDHSSKSFKLCFIYKLPPSKLIINELKKGELFVVTWKRPARSVTSFGYNYELCYWNESELNVQKAPDICPAHPIKINSKADGSVILLLNNPLRSSSHYLLMIRVRLHASAEDACYQGPWSEWSDVQTLTTGANTTNVIVVREMAKLG